MLKSFDAASVPVSTYLLKQGSISILHAHVSLVVMLESFDAASVPISTYLLKKSCISILVVSFVATLEGFNAA